MCRPSAGCLTELQVTVCGTLPHEIQFDSQRTARTVVPSKHGKNGASNAMSWLVRPFLNRERRRRTVPFVLAVVVVALAAVLYLELVATLLAYTG